MSSFFWTMFYSPDQGNEFEEYIQNDNLEAILLHEKLQNELQQTSNALHAYLSRIDTISKLIAYAYDPDENKKNLSSAANDVFVADISILLDAITSNVPLMNSLFMALRPYNQELGRYLTTEELEATMVEDVPAGSNNGVGSGQKGLPAKYMQRRIPLHVAENFCRLIIMLVRSPVRLKKLQQHILSNTYILTLFCQVICSAPSTEAIHYLIVGKDRASESVHLQTEIVLQSGIIQSMFMLFLSNAPFDSLMHASFIICSLLANGCTSPVRNLILENLPELVKNTLNPRSHPGTVRTLLQITVSGFREAIRFGILSEKEEESHYYANVVDNLIKACIPGFTEILSLQPTVSRPPPGSPPHALFQVPLVSQEATNAGMAILLKQQVISALAELLRLSEINKESIKEKEERTLQTTFRPDMAVEFIEEYYKAKARGDGSAKDLLPFTIGLSYIFQDVYTHLESTCKYTFSSHVAKVCTDANKAISGGNAAMKKTIGIQHTLGPDGEIIYGSSAYLTLLLLESGIPSMAMREMLAFPEQAVIHHPCSVVATQVLEFLDFAPKISLYLFDAKFFSDCKQALVNENAMPDASQEKITAACQARLAKQTRRTSLDAHIAAILSQLGRAAYGFKVVDTTIPPFQELKSIVDTNVDAKFLASILEVKEFLNFH